MSSQSPRIDDVGVALNALVGVLYALLGTAAAVKLVQKHTNEGFPFACRHVSSCCCAIPRCCYRRRCCCRHMPNEEIRSRVVDGSDDSAVSKHQKAYLVVFSLLVYSLLRSVQLLLFAARVVDTSGDLTTHLYTFFPALGFLSLQSTMLVKWVDHVSDLTLTLQHHPFRIGTWLIRASISLLIIESCVTALAVIDVDIKNFTDKPSHFWNTLTNTVCGSVYIFNGSAFAGLGCFLRFWLWIPVTQDGVHASNRILAIALLFGIMCVARGGLLCLYLGDSTPSAAEAHGGTSSGGETQVRKVTHNDWGAPAVLLVEWTTLVVTIALLGRSTSQQQQQQQDQYIISPSGTQQHLAGPQVSTALLQAGDDYDDSANALAGSHRVVHSGGGPFNSVGSLDGAHTIESTSQRSQLHLPAHHYGSTPRAASAQQPRYHSVLGAVYMSNTVSDGDPYDPQSAAISSPASSLPVSARYTGDVSARYPKGNADSEASLCVGVAIDAPGSGSVGGSSSRRVHMDPGVRLASYRSSWVAQHQRTPLGSSTAAAGDATSAAVHHQ